MRFFCGLSLIMFVAITLGLTALELSGAEIQQPQLVSDHPAVLAGVEQALAGVPMPTSQGNTKTAGMRPMPMAGGGVAYGGGVPMLFPRLVLQLNRAQLSWGDTLQARLYYAPSDGTNVVLAPFPSQTVRIIRNVINLATGETRSAYIGLRALAPWETNPLPDVIFDGQGYSGLYSYTLIIIDEMSGQVVAIPTARFLLGGFTAASNSSSVMTDQYMTHVEGAVAGNGYIYLRGLFTAQYDSSLLQYVLVDGRLLPIVKATQYEANAQLSGKVYVAPGIHDITLVVGRPGSPYYDCYTAPSVLRVYPGNQIAVRVPALPPLPSVPTP